MLAVNSPESPSSNYFPFLFRNTEFRKSASVALFRSKTDSDDVTGSKTNPSIPACEQRSLSSELRLIGMKVLYNGSRSRS